MLSRVGFDPRIRLLLRVITRLAYEKRLTVVTTRSNLSENCKSNMLIPRSGLQVNRGHFYQYEPQLHVLFFSQYNCLSATNLDDIHETILVGNHEIVWR